MAIDTPPIVVERVIDVQPQTRVQMTVEGRVVQSLEVPVGKVRVYLRITPYKGRK